MIAELRRVAELVTHPVLSTRRFDRHARVHSRTVRDRFGTWRAALDSADLLHRFSNCDSTSRTLSAKLSEPALLEALRRLARRKRVDFLRTQDIRDNGDPSVDLLLNRFGSVGKAVERAGLRYAPLNPARTRQELLDNLGVLWRHYGRAPTAAELNSAPSTIKRTSYLTQFGGWRNALVAFVDSARDDPAMRDCVSRTAGTIKTRRAAPVEPRDKREVPLSLRFNVLQRDRFRCTACGASPVHDAGCKLQVDHIVPFSKGGKTEPKNLRTLCSLCNLGKGARREKEARHRGAGARR